MYKILIIDDNQNFALSLADCLPKKLYHTEISFDGSQGYKLAIRNKYDLLIIDNILPSKTGLTIVKELRKEMVDAPALLISGDKSDSLVLRALNAGADNFLHKPFNLLEFKTRVESILRRPPRRQLPVLDFGDGFALDFGMKLLTYKAHPVILRKKEFTILEYLAQNSTRIISKHELTDVVWLNDPPTQSTLDVHISHLRRKLKAHSEATVIETKSNNGYRFVGFDVR